jgi:hypothetical protein
MNRAFGGLSPAFNSVPDLLGRLTYRHDSLELNRRGPLRELIIRTPGGDQANPGSSEAQKIEVTDVGALAAGAFPARKISRAFQRRAQRDGRLSSATVRAVTSMFMCGSDR